MLELSDPDDARFKLAKVSVGTLGVVSEMTLKCVPKHRLLEHTYTTTPKQVGRPDNHEEEEEAASRRSRSLALVAWRATGCVTLLMMADSRVGRPCAASQGPRAAAARVPARAVHVAALHRQGGGGGLQPLPGRGPAAAVRSTNTQPCPACMPACLPGACLSACLTAVCLCVLSLVWLVACLSDCLVLVSF